MVLAHLRGVLESGYPLGLQSMLREDMILDALDMEHRANMGIDRLTIEASFSAAYSAAGAATMWNNTRQSWDRYSLLKEFIKTNPATTGMAALSKVFESLEKSGFFEQIMERDKNLAAEIDHV